MSDFWDFSQAIRDVEQDSPIKQEQFWREILRTLSSVDSAKENTINEVIERFLISNEHALIRRIAADYEHTSEKVLEKLAQDNNSWVRVGVAKNPSSDLHLLEKLGNDDKWYVRKAVTENANVTKQLLELLSDDPDADVSHAAKAKIK